jgi:hypothetical protein
MKLLILIILVLSLLAFNAGFAGDVSRIGTTSGTQLLIPVGARSIALGEAVVSNVKGAEAIYYNPAGMSYYSKSEVLFSNMSYIADIKVNYIAGTFNGGQIGTFGLSIKSLDFGEIEETTEDYPEGTGNTYSPTFIVAGFSYARMLTDRIHAGVTAKYVSEKIMQTGASALAIDLGVQYAFNSKLRVGVVMKNIGTKMQYDGRNLERTTRIPGSSPDADQGYFRGVPLTSDIPSIFGFGVSYNLNFNEQNSVLVNGVFSNHNESSDEFYGGLEYAFQDLFFLRGGYTYNSQKRDDQIFDYTFGAGLKYPLGNFDFYFDYAYRQVSDYFDASNVFTVKLGL